MEKPTFVTADADNLYFHGADGAGLKVARSRIDKITRMHGYLGLVVGYMNFAFLPEDAAPSELLRG